MMRMFTDQLKRVSDFLSNKQGDIALLVIDVQKEFCDPAGKRGSEETALLSRKIKDIVPEFRKAGIPVYAVCFSCEKPKTAAEVDFYEVVPEPQDTLVVKTRNSAFQGSDIKMRLCNHKTLLMCGFNFNACVKDTALDARSHRFDVCVLQDVSGNDRGHSKDPAQTIEAAELMRKHGIKIRSSGEILENIIAANTNKKAPGF